MHRQRRSFPLTVPSQVSARRGSAILALPALVTLLLAATHTLEEWYVQKGAPGCPGTGTKNDPFCRIMVAVQAAANGDTIHIGPGTYRESILLDKDLTLIGTEGEQVTILDPRPTRARVLALQSGTVGVVRGLTLTGGYAYSYPYGGGGGVHLGYDAQPATLTLMSSTVSDNRGDGGYYFAALGGGIYNGNGVLTLIDSTVSDNDAAGGYYSASDGSGAGIHNRSGALTLIGSTVSGNSAFTSRGGRGTGGGIRSTGGNVVLQNSTVVDNGAYGIWYKPPVGAAIASSGALTMDNCTVSGNTHGIYPTYAAVSSAGPLTMANSIVWGNGTNSGIWSPNATVDYSNIQSGWTGAGSNNIDQDPGFVDPGNGDYTLTPGSVCIDLGNPAALPSGLDRGGNPRLLDGDLDRTMRVDMGAHEFDNVRLQVTGNATPGGTITVTTTGTAGMDAWLAVGLTPAETLIDPLGSVFFALGGPVSVIGLGPIPDATNFVLPPTLGVPLDVVMQELALGSPLPGGRRPGNVSNPVFLTIE